MALNTFLVSFSLRKDKTRVQANSPMSVKGSHVILKEWDPNTPFEKVTFNESPFWIQVHSLPPNCINLKNAEAMGNLIGRFLASDFDDKPQKKWKKFLRIKVAINVHHRLPTGFFHEAGHDNVVWIPFKYERLSEYYYKCGHLNHTEKECTFNGT